MICHKPTKKYPEGRTGTTAGFAIHRYYKEVACIDCREAQREYGRNRDSTELGRKKSRDKWLKRMYSIALEDYNNLLKIQDFCCGICGVSEDEFNESLSVDHDHSCCNGPKSCGKCVRGLLCRTCNRILGLARDNIARLKASADYLERSCNV